MSILDQGAARDPLRINSGEGGEQLMGGHMMSPGQEHMRQQQHGHTGAQETGEMRQDNRSVS